MSNACVCVCICVCVTTAGVVSTVAGSTAGIYVDGVGTVAKFYYPRGISVDSTGNAWVADSNNHMIRRINTAGRVHTCMHTRLYSASDMCMLHDVICDVWCAASAVV